MRSHSPLLTAFLLLATTASTQQLAPTAPDRAGEPVRLKTQGRAVVSTLDLDTGVITTLDPQAQLAVQAACFDNSIDGDGIADALLYPAGYEIFDWGVKSCAGSTLVESVTIGYGSRAVPVSSGGPGGSIELRIYASALGYGVPGTERLVLALSGLPSDGAGPFPPCCTLSPRILQIDLGSQAFFLPDGPIGWGFRNTDGDTAPLLVDATLQNGTENVFDVYNPGPAIGGSYEGTVQLLPGGGSNDPLENSFYLEIRQNDTPAQSQPIGAGQNPNNFSSAGAPIVGGAWFPSVNTLAFPSVTQTLVAVSGQRVQGVQTRWGELVVDLNRLLFPIAVKAGGLHRFDVPLDASLIGLPFFAQGGMFGPSASLQLTNGLELAIGAF